VITRVDIEHFKCFERLVLPLGRLTLMSGTNASGKSSVLQALVLLHQTMKESEWSTRLLLNGEELQLGTVTDVVDKVSGQRQFSLGIVDGERQYRWVFKSEDRKAMSVPVQRLDVAGAAEMTPARLHFLLPPELTREDRALADRMVRLSYLTAERMGPRDIYPLADPATTMQVVGPRGEHAASLLYWSRDEHIMQSLLLGGEPPTRFHQVVARMQQFFPGCALDVQPVLQANGVTLGFRTSHETDFHRPIHVGFGLTQVLPIIVAALSAKQDDILLIENPEVHLHPAGQARMGSFLSEVAAAGVQVILETHSDHVLNGLRRAVKAQVIAADDVCIHFLRDRSLDGDQVSSPTINGDGNLDAWPDGFFDQFDKDMNHFAGWGE